MQRTRLDWRWPLGVAAGCLAALAEAAPGDLDTNYGVGGRAVPASSAEQVGMLLPVAGDRLVYSVETADGVELRRLDSRGSPDATFGVAGRLRLPGVSNPAHAGAVAPNDKLLFASFVQRTVDGAQRYIPAAVRVDASGHPDNSFGPDRNGIATLSALPSFDESIVAMATYPDGRIALMGFDGSYEGSCGEVIVRRLRVDGSEDTAFGSGGLVRLRNDQNCDPPSLGPRSDGSLLVVFGSSAWRLTASGAIDPGFGTAGTAPTGGDWPFRSAVLADGRYLAASRHDPSGRGASASIRLARFLGSGQADPGFGSGTGSVVIAAGNALTGRSDLQEQVLDLAVSRDERQIYLLVDIRSADSLPRPTRYACRSVVRLSAAGVLDPAYGRNGVACLVRGADLDGSFGTVLPREDGSVLVDSRYAPVTDLRRLLGDATPSAGIISVQSDFAVAESAGRMTVTIGRSAGVDGAVSVEYSTGDFAGTIISPLNLASSGLDYRPASGRLDWASGDSTDRTITIDLIDDRLEELPEYFVLRLANPGGGAIIIDATRMLQIDDNDTRAVVAPSATTPVDNGGGGGGGGSTGGMTLAILAAALRVVRRNPRQQRPDQRQVRTTRLPSG